MVVVSNSSPLIALARIQRLDLLPTIFESVLIPPAVAREIAPSLSILPIWLRLQGGLAIELKANWIILDDLPARRSAAATGLNVIGTLGTLATAKRVGLLKSIHRWP